MEKSLHGFGVTWHKADGISFLLMEENKLLEITIGEKRIGILKKKDNIYAFAATCPHAGASLCGGWLDGLGRIVCPEHKYRFDPANGRNTSGEGYKLFTYPVELRGEEIYIGIRPA